MTAPNREADVTPFGVARALVRHWRAVVLVPAAFIVAAVTYALLATPKYTATSAFVPESRSQSRLPSAIAGLAGQLGVPLGGEASQSPRFYSELARSREIMERVLRTRFAVPAGASVSGDSATLLAILGRGGRDLPDSLSRGTRALGRAIAVRVDIQTNIVRLSVETRYPDLSAAVANRVVGFLNDFNANTRQSQARTRRSFVEARITEVERELHQAENDLKTFYERNHSWQRSPLLVVEDARLRRQENVLQEVFLTLKREYETARIEEVNDTPVITVIDAAVPPHERSRPNRRMILVLSAVLGMTLGIVWAGWAEYVGRLRHASEGEYQGLRADVQRMRGEVAQTLGVLRGKRDGA